MLWVRRYTAMSPLHRQWNTPLCKVQKDTQLCINNKFKYIVIHCLRKNWIG